MHPCCGIKGIKKDAREKSIGKGTKGGKVLGKALNEATLSVPDLETSPLWLFYFFYRGAEVL